MRYDAYLVRIFTLTFFSPLCFAQTLSPLSYFTDNCAGDDSAIPAPHLFQNPERLQLSTSFTREIPNLTAYEYRQYQRKEDRRASILALDIQEQAKGAGGFSEGSEPNYIIEGHINQRGNVSDAVVKKMSDGQKKVALRSLESGARALRIDAIGYGDIPITTYNYDLYQIIYLSTKKGLEPRRVKVSTFPCGEDSVRFVSQLGQKKIQHERATIPFRVFLELDDKVETLEIGYGVGDTFSIEVID